MAEPNEAREERKRLLAAELLRSGSSLKMQALGTSMVPTIWPGDVLTLEPGPKAIRVGDIVLFRQKGRFFIHRIVEECSASEAWRTRGDAVPQEDPPIAAADVLGRVTIIERDGRVLVPRRRRSVLHRVTAWALCYCALLRNAAPRLTSSRRPNGGLADEVSY